MPVALTGTAFPIAFLVLTLVPLGGARSERALYSFATIGATIFVAVVARRMLRDRENRPVLAAISGSHVAPLLALTCFVLAQAVAQSTLGFSLAPAFVIWQSFAFLTAISAFYVLVYAAISDHAALRRLIGALVIIGALEAVYGVLNLLSGNERLLIYERWMHFNSATGTFYSRNQFAFLMEMTLPLAIASGSMLTAFRDPEDRGRVTHSEQQARRVLIGTCGVAIGLGLIFSRSRMGMLSLLAASILVGVVNLVRRPDLIRLRPVRGGNRAPYILAAIVLFYAAVIGLEPVVERFLRIEQDLEEARWPIWQATLAMIRDAPMVGHGWASFGPLLPGYRPRPTGIYFDHAHNDYLEVISDGGIVGFAIIASMIVLFARSLTHVLAQPLSQQQRSVVTAIAVAITSILFHSIADFGLRVPGIAFTFAGLAALYCRAIQDPMLVDPDFDPRAALTLPRRSRHQRKPGTVTP